MSVRCPRCNSPSPSQHPAMQIGGEVQICPDPFHKVAEAARFIPAQSGESKEAQDVDPKLAGSPGSPTSRIVESHLEPGAWTDKSITSDRPLLVQTSIAISLKRIADALEAANANTPPLPEGEYWRAR